MPEFCHLHCHTQYSLLDGAARIKTLLAKSKEMEMPAVAITDHGNLYGVPEFYMKAQDLGILPIIGCEFYITPSGMQDKSDRTRYHQVLLAKNEQGYRNLIKLSSLSYTDGYYYKPRIDKDTLKKHREGLIATTCCLQGEVLQAILHKGEEAARPIFESYLDIFGDDYYIELQDHGIPEQRRCNEVLVRWAKWYNVKVIATNDVHYVNERDAEAQDVLLCLQTGKDLNDPNRMRFENNQFFLKSKTQMQAAFTDLDPKIRDLALDTTREVADKCQFKIPMGKLLMPQYPIPPPFNNDIDAYLRHLVYEGAKRRYPEMPQDVIERLDFELATIKQMGFAGYFLIVQDFTTAARTLGVSVGPGRGSAAGSAIAYCLGITNIDPLKYDLLFERFLNPERVSMPDIDIDFDDRGRGKVIDYVVQKYGRENVCQIITFGTMGARSVIRDVARVLGIPLAEADRIAKLIPEGPKENLDTAKEKVAEFAALFDSPDSQIRKLMEFSKVLEGSARHTGVHAAGVIIAPGDVSEYVPVSIAKGKTAAEDVVTTQYDGKWVESFGLLKMDFLGLKTLTILNDALDLIKKNYGAEIDLDAIPLDDKKTFELFQRGETVSIFQFESNGMREYMKQLKPTCVDDLIAMNALYRPGPMDLIPNYIARKHGRETVEYPHTMLEGVLKPTYGIPIYQEQVMQMAQVMANYTLGGADLLRRAMGKKKKEEMDKQRATFVKGAGENQVPEAKANEVFDIMEKFAGYGFNKCLVGNTELIEAETGEKTTIATLFKRPKPFKIHALGKDWKLKVRKVTDLMWNGKKPVFELTTAKGRKITATGNHPFRTLNGWTNLEALKVGHQIALPRKLNLQAPKALADTTPVNLASSISTVFQPSRRPIASHFLTQGRMETNVFTTPICADVPTLVLLPQTSDNTWASVYDLGAIPPYEDCIPTEIWAWVEAERMKHGLTWDALEKQLSVSMKAFIEPDLAASNAFSRDTIFKLASFFNSQPLREIASSDVFWDEIISIEPSGIEDTYDLTVEEDHNFVANGIIVHNSHSAAYSVVAYQTAYLKANFPPAFLAAAMTSEMGDTKKLAIVLEEARHMGIKVLPPDINRSRADFSVERDKIRFGLAAIKGVGAGAIEVILQERDKNGPFESLFDLSKRIDLRSVNKKTLEGLASAGAFDTFEGHRAQLVAALDDAVKYGQRVQQDKISGALSLFGESSATAADVAPNLPFVNAWSRGEMLRNERELVGFYVSGHPLDEYYAVVRAFSTGRFGNLDQLEPDREYRFCGIITDYQKRFAKNGKPFAFITLEDFEGAGEITIFSNQFEKFGQYLNHDELVMVVAKLERRDGRTSLIARDLMPMWQVQEKFVKSVVLKVHTEAMSLDELEAFKTTCDENRGTVKLYFDLFSPAIGHAIRLRSRHFVVDPSPEFMRNAERIFGLENIQLLAD